MIRRYYGDKDPVANQVREMLFLDLINSMHISEVAIEFEATGAVEEPTIHVADNEVFVDDGDVIHNLKSLKGLAAGSYRVLRVADGKVYIVHVIYEWRGGMPSGHPLTTIVTSLSTTVSRGMRSCLSYSIVVLRATALIYSSGICT